MPTYRIIREEEKITILHLQNGKWRIYVTLKPDDQVQFAPKGFKKAKDMNDADLIYYIVGGDQ